ncbi:MAG: type III-A CRISPR-associated RAMP protein Csm5 [Haliscomenobacter sp.]|nr:type III-A CRISPR-associated RAMP protein Csm5 [Haliscomenobacter sp.]
MKLFLRTVSPVHIGTGETLGPLEYVVLQETFYRITEDQLIALTQSLLPDNGTGKLAEWVSQTYANMRDIRDNRELAALSDRMNPYYFFAFTQKSREFVQAVRQRQFGISGIPVRLDQRTKSKYRNDPVTALGQVRVHIRDARNTPYIPGSSLKGSLRTALLYHYLRLSADRGQVEKVIQEQLAKRQSKERFGLPLTHVAFFCGTKDAKGKFKADDEKMDLLKLVRFTDAHLPDRDDAVHLAKMNMYLVSKKEVGPKGESDFKADEQSQASYCEIIPAGAILEAELDFDIDFLLQAKKFLKGEGIPQGGGMQWIGLETKVMQLFSLNLSELTDTNKEEKKAQVIRHLLACWADFCRRQVDANRDWLAHFERHDPSNEYSSRIKKGMQAVEGRATQGQLCHLGYATGFKGMTAILYFLQDRELENLYKRILEAFQIGNKPGNRGPYKVNMLRFPKSRRMLDMGPAIEPLGWLELAPTREALLQIPASSSAQETPPPPPKAPVEPAYFSGQFNFKKPPELDAVVIESGRPNKVQVYVRKDYMPILALSGYATPLEKGTVIIVRSVINKKNEVVQVSFGKKK